jgi:hypothetical protein
MTKLEVTQEGDLFLYNFTLEDGSKRIQRYSKTTHEAIKSYFTPKEIVDIKSIPEFDELWKLHPKGNKKTAKDRFIKVVKKVSFAELKSKLEPYIKSNDFCYLKGLDVWLNPEKEYWNDLIVKKEDKFKKEEKIDNTTSFFREG